MRKPSLLVLVLLSVGVQATERIPSWMNLATGGAGRALQGNPSSVFGNPAAITQPRHLEGELGVGGVGDQLYGWSAWTMPVGTEASLGLGVTEPDPGALDRHRLDFSGVARPFLGSWIGARGTYQKNPIDSRIELGLGGMHRLSSALFLGWTLRNLTESLDSSFCDQCHDRNMGLGVSWNLDAKARKTLWVDAELKRLQWRKSDWIGTGGFKIDIGEHRNLQLLGGMSLQNENHSWQSKASAGLAFQQYFFTTLVNIRYALSDVELSGGSGLTPTHAISLGVVLDAFEDRIEPKPFVRSELALLSPNGEQALPRSTNFLLRVEENSGKLAEWTLVIYTAKADLSANQVVRRFKGAGLPPRAIRWDGDDVSGRPCNPGLYTYRLIAQDVSGNQAWTEWQHIEIR